MADLSEGETVADRRSRRPQIQVYLPDDLINVMNAAVDTASSMDVRPSTLSELVEDAVRQHLPVVARRVNRGRNFDRDHGARVRAARARSNGSPATTAG